MFKRQPIFYLFYSGLFLLSYLCQIPYANAEEQISSQQFLDKARRNHPVDTWGILEGEVSHKRRGSETITAPIKFAVRFTPSRVLAKITINKDETYTVGQPYSETQPSVIADEGSLALSSLANYGLRPEDLTMTFLYWKFKEELKPTSVKGMDCRVFLLENPETKEEVKVYIGANYFYPIEIEWFRPEEKVAYRTCMINSFKETNKLWTPDSFTLTGPGWRTNVDFGSAKIRLGFVSEGVPKDLF